MCMANRRRIENVAHQTQRGFVAHPDRQVHHFHQHYGQDQDHGAVGRADLFRQPFGVLGEAMTLKTISADSRNASSLKAARIAVL